MAGSKACPACGGHSSTVWGRHSNEPIRACADCGTAYFERPITRPHDYDTYYPYLAQYDDARFNWELDQRRRNIRFQLKEIERLGPPGRRLVDFGAGYGHFCAIAQEAGWTASAVEGAADAVEAGSRRYGVHYTSFDDVADGSCSALTSFHVVEHLDEPAAFLRLFRQKLAPGGVLVLHVPNRESLSAWLAYRWKQARRKSDERSGCLYYPEHITGFTAAGLIACARRTGFDLVRLRQRTVFSRFYDPWLLRNFLYDTHGRRSLKGPVRLGKRIVKGALDQLGSVSGYGDWLIAHFRAR